MIQFESYSRIAHGVNFPRLRIYPNGMIHFNTPALDLIGRDRLFVNFYYSKEGFIGFDFDKKPGDYSRKMYISHKYCGVVSGVAFLNWFKLNKLKGFFPLLTREGSPKYYIKIE